jgi:hypothetical protein
MQKLDVNNKNSGNYKNTWKFNNLFFEQPMDQGINQEGTVKYS